MPVPCWHARADDGWLRVTASNCGERAKRSAGTDANSASTANGTSMGSQSPVQIIMVDNSGNQKDSTSAINGAGGFSNTWLRAN